jgi:hypothetical protein
MNLRNFIAFVLPMGRFLARIYFHNLNPVKTPEVLLITFVFRQFRGHLHRFILGTGEAQKHWWSNAVVRSMVAEPSSPFRWSAAPYPNELDHLGDVKSLATRRKIHR